MPSTCPHCGTEVHAAARFPAASFFAAHSCRPDPAPPVRRAGRTPAAAPFTAFLRRALRGGWAGPVRAASGPAVLLASAAAALAVPRYGQPPHGQAVGYADRLRIALAVLLKGLLGGFALRGGPHGGGLAAGLVDGVTTVSLVPMTVTVLWLAALYGGVRRLGAPAGRARAAGAAGAHAGAPGFGTPSGAPVPRRRGRGWRAPFVPGPRPGTASVRGAGAASGTDTDTRRSPTPGLEAAVRVAVAAAVGTFVLALVAQPEVRGVRIDSAPLRSACGALLLGLAVSGGVLGRGELGAWAARRPGVRVVLEAWGTAVRALGMVLVVGAAAGVAALTRADGIALPGHQDGGVPLLLPALLVLPNLAVAVLALSWGVPLTATAGGSAAAHAYATGRFGYAQLAGVCGGRVTVCAALLGSVCALAVGATAARRHPGRGARLLAAAFFTGLFVLLAAAGGIRVEASTTALTAAGVTGSAAAGVSVPDAALYAAAWACGAALAAPWLTGGALPAGVGAGVGRRGGVPGAGAGEGRVTGRTEPAGAGRTPGVGRVPAPAAPYGASLTARPGAPHPGDGGATAGSRQRRAAALWVAGLAAVFLVASGATAAVLLWQAR